MTTARRMSAAAWTRPANPKSVSRPSWIGGRPAPSGTVARSPFAAPEPAPSVPPPPPPSGRGGGSLLPPSARPLSHEDVLPPVRPLTIPPGSTSLLGTMRASIAPQMTTAREVELETELETVRAQLASLAAQFAAVRGKVIEESEPEIVRLALAVAKRVVDRAVSAEPSVLVGWIKEGINAMPNRDTAIVAISADVAAAMPVEQIEQAIATNRVVVDSMLPPGSCEVRDGDTIAQVGANERIASLADALGVDRR